MGCSSSSTTIGLTGFSTLIHPGGGLSGSGKPKLPAMQEDRTFEAPCQMVVPAGLRRESCGIRDCFHRGERLWFERCINQILSFSGPWDILVPAERSHHNRLKALEAP